MGKNVFRQLSVTSMIDVIIIHLICVKPDRAAETIFWMLGVMNAKTYLWDTWWLLPHKWLDIFSRFNGLLHGNEFDSNQIRGKTKCDQRSYRNDWKCETTFIRSRTYGKLCNLHCVAISGRFFLFFSFCFNRLDPTWTFSPVISWWCLLLKWNPITIIDTNQSITPTPPSTRPTRRSCICFILNCEEKTDNLDTFKI